MRLIYALKPGEFVNTDSFLTPKYTCQIENYTYIYIFSIKSICYKIFSLDCYCKKM